MKNIGGQAVIEGVMMKSTLGWSVAVRDPRGEIQIKSTPLKKPSKLLNKPFIRGVIALFHALVIGIKALEYSASMAYEEEEGEKPISNLAMALTMATSMGLAVVLFIVLPLYAAKLIGIVLPAVDKSSTLFNIADGVVRIFIFFLYIVLIGLWGEMRRVFEYHGAEHMVLHAYESEKELSIQNIRQFSTVHTRCGTSFMMIVMVISIVVFSLIPMSWPLLYKFLSRVVLIPVIAGISYELLKYSDSKKDNAIIALLIKPGLALQRLTTYPPDDKQIQVALAALEEVLLVHKEPSHD